MKTKENPFVMCLTNTVASNFTANVLLAIGAKPAMIEEPSEAEALAKVADAVLVNLGTVNPRQADVMRAALRGIAASGTPWVLDPVACHLLSYRATLMKEFLSAAPSLIRGNHDEIDWLRRECDPKCVMLSTGEIDRVYENGRLVEEISGGVKMLQTVTATGCSQGAICAAALGMGMSPLEAAKWTSRKMKKSGEIAYAKSPAPGSFQISLIDALANSYC